MPRGILWAMMPTAVVVLVGWSWAQEPASSGAPSRSSVSSPAGGAATPSQATVPNDIYPDSTARLPKVKREDLDEEGKKTYDFMVNPNTRYSAGLPPPLAMWMHSAKMAQYVAPLYMYLRFGNQFGQRLTEVAILVSARENNAQFQWTSHEPVALELGVEREVIETIKYRKSLEHLGDKDALVIRFGRELIRDRKVSSETFAHVLKVFGRQGVTDLAALMAFYNFMYTVSNITFDIQMPAGQKPLLPIP